MVPAIIISVGVLLAICLYCCLVVASREDDAMEEYFKDKSN